MPSPLTRKHRTGRVVAPMGRPPLRLDRESASCVTEKSSRDKRIQRDLDVVERQPHEWVVA